MKTIKNENGVYVELPKDKIEFVSKEAEIIYDLSLENDFLEKENQELKKQLEYLRSGEYLNQLKFERNMLEDVVNKGEVSKEDKEFIDMTHRNTELLEQQKEFIEWLEQNIENEEYCYLAQNPSERCRKDVFEEILSKYKEIIGKDINVSTKEMIKND